MNLYKIRERRARVFGGFKKYLTELSENVPNLRAF